MMARVLVCISLFMSVVFTGYLNAQDKLLDPSSKLLLDSLTRRAEIIRIELPRLAEQRNPRYYFIKRDYEVTLFLIDYYHYLVDEDLEQSRELTETKLKVATKMNDTYLIDFYTEYNNKYAIEYGRQQARYQKLFEKEKNFRKELFNFLDENTEYSLLRAKRMTELAIKYANEKKLESVSEYLKRYSLLTDALIFDYYSDYDLKKLTSSELIFQKVFMPMVESDSIEQIEEAGKLVEYCNSYAANSLSVLDTNYFVKQRMVVKTSISDYNERKGNNLNLANLDGQSIIVRLDTLNKEGIYKWHDKIVVISTVKFSAKFDNVKRGEAIINADKKLIQYIRVNKIAKVGKEINVGATFLIPYIIDDKKADFCFNPVKKEYQYMVCYTRIESKYVTKGISKFLPPMQLREELTAMQ